MILPFRNASYRVVEKLSCSKIIEQYSRYCGIKIDRYYETLDTLEIRECSDTKLRYYYPPTTIGDSAFYQNLLQKGDYSRGWEFDHQFVYQRLLKSDALLEIGCGNGTFMEKSKEKGAEVYGIELNQGMVDICNQKGLEVINQSIQDFSLANEGKFDVICMFQVLEHIYDVEDFLTSVLKCLKKGGRIYISTPNNEPYFANDAKYETLNLPPHHMTLWNMDAYQNVANRMGLTLKSYAYSASPGFKGKVYFKLQRLMDYEQRPINLMYVLSLVQATLWTILDIFRGKYHGNYMVIELEKPHFD